MIRKIILIALLLFNPITANAGFWDALGACFTDPCNCGDSNSEVYENWNGQLLDKGKKNSLCPPWNKGAGRDDNTCIVMASYPGAFIGYYKNLCGEETPESTYLNPMIKVRGQQCNFAGCWTTSDSLSWDGECVTLAGSYGLPLLRMCARIAIPANYQANFPQDPGYTIGQHLDFEGATVPDDVIIGYDGQPVVFNAPKLCLYSDPAFLSFSDGFDVMDLNPNKQSFHKTTQVHPVVKVIIFFFSIAEQSAQTPFQLLSSLFGIMGGNGNQTTFSSVLKDIFTFISDVIGIVGNLIITYLNQIGQINRAVDDTIYGCVNLPMGPYPPPFCPTIAPFFQTAYTQNICLTGSDGYPVKSVENDPCVVSTLTNNFVRNSIRITFENFVPLCQSGTLPVSDECVSLNNLGVLASASGLHAITAKTDILPPCTNAPAGAVCVNTTIPHTCSVSANGCQSGFRVVYGITIGNISTPQSYFRDDLTDCPSNSAVACQEIWGINTSEFVDVSLVFPPVQSSPDITPLQTSISLVDKTGLTVNFVASIVRVATFDSVFQLTQQPNQICVTQGDIVVGCENRAPFTQPQIYDCTSPSSPASCTSSYFVPRFIATVTSGNDSTSAVVEPLSVYDTNNLISTVNLAGYNFGSFVTDSTFAQSPFSGANSPNPSSLYGTYQNNASPINSDFSENTKAVYLYGLEYINNQYHLGGKYACLQNLDTAKCPTNVPICVLSNLLNSNIVNCQNFVTKLSTYTGLTLCSALAQSTCTTHIDSLPRIGGGAGISIYSCGANKGYCYTSPGNVNVCQISNSPADRYIPAASLGTPLSASQYFDINNVSPGYSYDQTLYSLRDKTSYEMNLCTTIPQPTCAAVSTYSQDDGYAAWPETPVGQIATGSCNTGGTPVAPLQRRCVPNGNTQTFNFEPLYSWDYSQSPAVKVYSNVQCQYPPAAPIIPPIIPPSFDPSLWDPSNPYFWQNFNLSIF